MRSPWVLTACVVVPCLVLIGTVHFSRSPEDHSTPTIRGWREVPSQDFHTTSPSVRHTSRPVAPHSEDEPLDVLEELHPIPITFPVTPAARSEANTDFHTELASTELRPLLPTTTGVSTDGLTRAPVKNDFLPDADFNTDNFDEVPLPDTEVVSPHADELLGSATGDSLHGLLVRERGLAKLIRMAENLVMEDRYKGQGLGTANCTPHADFIRGRGSTASLCLQPGDLRPTLAPPIPLHVFLREMFNRGAKFDPFGRDKAAHRFGSLQWPYISGTVFRHMADAIQETWSHFWFGRDSRKRRIRGYKSINASAWEALPNRSLLYWNMNPYKKDINLLRELLPNIKQHFFLVAHNQDNVATPRWLLDHPKVLKVFSAEVPSNVTHPKLIPVPLGVHPTKRIFTLHKARRRSYDILPTHWLHLQFSPENGPRKLILKVLRGTELFTRAMGSIKMMCETMVNCTDRWASKKGDKGKAVEHGELAAEYLHVEQEHYFYLMLTGRYTLCPPGNGVDTYRLWEVLTLGRVPVVDHTMQRSLFRGLPVVVVDDWHQVGSMDFLQREWDKLRRRRFFVEPMFMPYWVRTVLRECLLTP